jgi:hypothetical protein
MSEKNEAWEYPEYDRKGRVYCQECGKTFMLLTPSHLKTHGLRYAEYKDKYPGAPTSTEEFKALSKYSKPNKYTDEDYKILGTEVVIDEDIPVIDDEFEMPKAESAKHFDTPMEAKKYEILTFLLNFLKDVKMDYPIEIFDGQGVLLFSAISDYADPFQLINIQFPDTFWHNRDLDGENPNRDRKLQENGWKVINIKSNSPSINDIEKELRKYL